MLPEYDADLEAMQEAIQDGAAYCIVTCIVLLFAYVAISVFRRVMWQIALDEAIREEVFRRMRDV